MKPGKELKKADAGAQGLAPGFWSPKIDVTERGDELVVSADLPDVVPEDVEVDIARGVLSISATRRSEREEDEDGWFYSESSYGSFERRFSLPEDIDPNSKNVRLENGRLEIVLKKRH